MFESLSYHTIDPPKKFPTISGMKRMIPLACALLAACRGGAPVPAASSVSGPVVEVRRSFACPLPPSRGLITIGRDGKAERVIFDGLEFELGKTRTTRETMTLAPKDAAAVFRLVADSDWRSIPEQPAGEASSCADCCSGALYLKTTEGGRSLNYFGDRVPERLEALLKGIDDILGRGTWERVVHPWEPQR